MSDTENSYRNDFGNVACSFKHLAIAQVNFHEVLQKIEESGVLPEELKHEFLRAYYYIRREVASMPKSWKAKSDDEAIAYLLALSCFVRRIRNIVERVAFEITFTGSIKGLIENAFYEDVIDLVGNLGAAEKHLNDAATIILSNRTKGERNERKRA